MFLATEHSLLRRLEQYKLYRRGKNINYENLRLAYQTIEKIFHGLGNRGGYRTVWHTLEMEGICIPRKFVQIF